MSIRLNSGWSERLPGERRMKQTTLTPFQGLVYRKHHHCIVQEGRKKGRRESESAGINFALT